jgi:tRNA-Thr(GGU) m(6)t(6)A37 methyltransferase TsaA
VLAFRYWKSIQLMAELLAAEKATLAALEHDLNEKAQVRPVCSKITHAVSRKREGRTHKGRKSSSRTTAGIATGCPKRNCIHQLQEQKESSGHAFHPIGYVNSCFPARCGTPRQGILAPSTIAKIVLSKHIPPASLEGVAEYSHLWVIFIFDENTNACSEKGTSKKARTFPAKVSPPQLLGKRTGLFSTRTPHRPCPIGLSVVRVVSVDEATRTITVSGIDLVNDTPVLDIKPYIPAYDSIPAAACARWVVEGGAPLLSVELSDNAKSQATAMRLPAESMYAAMPPLLQALREVLQLDIRSTHQGRGASAAADAPYEMHFDCLRVQFRTSERCLVVEDLALENAKKQRYRAQTAITPITAADSSEEE